MTEATRSATPARAFHQRECLLPTLGYYGAILALGLAMAVLGPTLLGLASQTQSDTGAISVVFVANAVGYMLGSLLGGSGYDRRAGHRLLAAAILLMAGMLALTPWMVHLWSLGAVLLVLGVTEGIVDVGSNTLLVWVHRDRVAPWMNGLHFCFGVGSVLAPLIVGGTLSLARIVYQALAQCSQRPCRMGYQSYSRPCIVCLQLFPRRFFPTARTGSTGRLRRPAACRLPLRPALGLLPRRLYPQVALDCCQHPDPEGAVRPGRRQVQPDPPRSRDDHGGDLPQPLPQRAHRGRRHLRHRGDCLPEQHHDGVGQRVDQQAEGVGTEAARRQPVGEASSNPLVGEVRWRGVCERSRNEST